MIRGITFSEQAFYSDDFAHFQNLFLDGNNGITQGCQITHDDTTVIIGTGRFIVHGRMMCIEEDEIVRASQGFSSGYNRIVYEIDLSKENTITEFRQGYIKVLNTEELIQEDLDNGGSVYQFPFCHFQWSGTTITDLIIDAATMVLDNIFGDVVKNFAVVNAQFDTWFNGQKQAILEMIAGLEAQGFQKTAMYYNKEMTASGWTANTKKYSFESEYPSATYHIDIQPSDRCTDEQLEAWGSALIVGSNESNVYTAKWDVPKVDIPIILKVVKK